MEPKPHLPLACIMTVLALAALALVLAKGAGAATITVPDDYATIQQAIDNATAGDTIRVHAGSYAEAIVVTKSLSIVGNGTAETAIQTTAANLVSVMAADVTIADLRVSGATGAGISITGDNCTVRDVLCSANNNGLVIASVSNAHVTGSTFDSNGNHGINGVGDSGTRIDNCTASNNSMDGIRMENDNGALVEDCLARDNANFGMFLFQVSTLTVKDNAVLENKYGIYLQDSDAFDIVGNAVWDNDGQGVGVVDCAGSGPNTVRMNDIQRNGLVMRSTECGVAMGGLGGTQGLVLEDNLINGNHKGIVLSFGGTFNNVIRGNTVKNNNVLGIENFALPPFFPTPPGPNTFYHNNFVGNPTHVQAPNAADTFDNGFPSGGNYWDNHAGVDLYTGPAQDIWGSDGLGDAAHPVAGGVVDNYPLMDGYSDPMDSIAIVDPSDGAMVEGTVIAEAVVVSASVFQVDFYVGNTMVGHDTTAPFQLVLDTTTLAEDTSYTLRAEARRRFGATMTDEVVFTVNNAPTVGSFISVSTLASTYSPDQRMTAIVTLLSPPPFDTIQLMPAYSDGSGNVAQVPSLTFPSSSMYGFVIWLPSDVALGTLGIQVHAQAFLGGSLVWESTNVTSVNVTGQSYAQDMASMLTNLTTVLSRIEGLNATTQTQLAQVLSDVLAAMDDMGNTLGSTMSDMWADYNTTEDADLASILLAISSMWDGINATAAMGFDEVMAGLNSTEANMTDAMDALSAYLAGRVDLSQQEVQANLDELWQGLNGSFTDLDSAMAEGLASLGGSIAGNATAMIDYLDLKNAQLALYMEVMNASIQLRMDSIDQAIQGFRDLVLSGLSDISTYLVVMEQNSSDRDEVLMDAIETTQDLIDSIDSTSLAELRAGLVALSEDLSGLNDSEADRHAATVGAMIAGLDGLNATVNDRHDETDAALDSLSALEAIQQELQRLSGEVADTRDAVDASSSGPLTLLGLLIVLALVIIGFLAIMVQRMKNLERPPGEPPEGDLEAVVPGALVPEEPPEEALGGEHFELMMEEPVMYSYDEEPETPPPEEEPPAPEPEPPAPPVIEAPVLDTGTEAPPAPGVPEEVPPPPEGIEEVPPPPEYPEEVPPPLEYPEEVPPPPEYAEEVLPPPEYPEEIPPPPEYIDEIPPPPEYIDEIPPPEPSIEEPPSEEVPEGPGGPEPPDEPPPDEPPEETEEKGRTRPKGKSMEDWVLEEIMDEI